MNLTRKIIVTTQFIAKHNWETCNIPEVSYLKECHRHIFYVTLEVEIFSADRELEFFTVQAELNKFITLNFSDKFLKNKSCEMIAEDILKWGYVSYGENITVRVMEDNENGAEVSNKDS